jgi:hypothetical protein
LTIVTVCVIGSMQANDLLPKDLQQFGIIPTKDERKAGGIVEINPKPVIATRNAQS